METTELIMLMGGGIGSLVLGALTKRIGAIPNALIPLVNGAVFTVLFATIGKLGWTQQAILTGMAAAYAGTALYEAGKVGKAKAAGLFAMLLLLLPLAWAPAASAEEQKIVEAGGITVSTYGPAYVATHYSSSDAYSQDAGPWLRARGGLIGELWQAPKSIRSVAIMPQARMTWEANQWPTGAPSSPITESHYMPGMGFELSAAPGATWNQFGPVTLERITVWPLDHLSTGTDANSASLDKVTVETKWTWQPSPGVLVTGYARGWYVSNVGAETLGMLSLMNWDFLRERFGGDAMLKLTLAWIELAGLAGLTSQDLEVFVPFANPWRASFYAWCHNGEIDTIVQRDVAAGFGGYTEATVSGGAGVALFR